MKSVNCVLNQYNSLFTRIMPILILSITTSTFVFVAVCAEEIIIRVDPLGNQFVCIFYPIQTSLAVRCDSTQRSAPSIPLCTVVRFSFLTPFWSSHFCCATIRWSSLHQLCQFCWQPHQHHIIQSTSTSSYFPSTYQLCHFGCKPSYLLDAPFCEYCTEIKRIDETTWQNLWYWTSAIKVYLLMQFAIICILVIIFIIIIKTIYFLWCICTLHQLWVDRRLMKDQ